MSDQSKAQSRMYFQCTCGAQTEVPQRTQIACRECLQVWGYDTREGKWDLGWPEASRLADASTVIAAFRHVLAALEPLGGTDRQRVLLAVHELMKP